MSRQFVYPFTVSSFDSDALGEMRTSALVRRLQVAADGHARQHELTVDQLLTTGRTWVLRSLSGSARAPRFLEPCRVTTWASSRSAGIRAWRDFLMESATGERLVVATSLWLMLDVARWKLIRLPAEVFAMVNPEPEPALEPMEIGEDFAAERSQDEIRVHWLDVDLNGHVNNVRYLDWMLAAIPDAQWRQQRLTRLAVDFQDEARPGDVLYPAVRADGDSELRLRIGSSDGRRLTLGGTRWEQRTPS
ncbi:MAG: hypothetical protein KIT83_06010 [Bryobacterales bacterium]|nr:hypothetical protein [Bryobacterales bacterium]